MKLKYNKIKKRFNISKKYLKKKDKKAKIVKSLRMTKKVRGGSSPNSNASNSKKSGCTI